MEEPPANEPYVPTVDPAVVEDTHLELQALRARHGRLTMPGLSTYPRLVQLCGEGDLLEAYMVLRRELARYANGTKYEAAGALSISSPADTVLERLTLTAEHFDYQDQRTIRRWSDRGLRTIAEDLAAIANVRGRLGRELLTLTLANGEDEQLYLRIEQMDFAQLPTEPPKITLWIWADEDSAEEAVVDLREHRSLAAEDGTYRNTLDVIAMPRLKPLLEDKPRRQATDKVLTVAVQGRSAPARTVTWRNEAVLPATAQVEVIVHRTMVMATLTSLRVSMPS
ncbi:hypothetical protein [Tessaracoccus aquimaris]|nr:hypothetical protein [Tessaracoccus aquimaris]